MKFIDKCKEIIETKSDYVLIGFLATLILPFLILHYFNQPISEDIYYIEEARTFGFSKSFRFLYKYWGGRYVHYALLNFNPLFFKSIPAYKMSCLLYMLLFLFVLYLFVSEITKNFLLFREKLLLSLSIFFLYLFSMPSVAEGFYWFGCMTSYLNSMILILAFSYFYIRSKNEIDNRKRIKYYFICGLLILAIPGCSEFGAALTCLIILLLIVQSYFSKKKFDWSLILYAVLLSIGVYFLISAVGNYNRAVPYAGKHDLIFSISSSFVFTIQNMVSWIFISPLLPITLLLVPIFLKIVKGCKETNCVFKINPLYSLSIWIVSLCLSSFVVFWSMGAAPYDRIVNFIYFEFLMGWFWNVIVLIIFLEKKFDFNPERIPKYTYLIAFVIICLFLFKENNIVTAHKDLFYGDAKKFNDEFNERYEYITHSSCDSCQIDSIKTIPKSFYFLDITIDPKVVSNNGYARYFNKKYIYLKK